MRLIIRDAGQRAWLRFESPRSVITATRVGDVLPALEQVDAAVARGAWAAGFIAYEAAPAFDSALRTHAAGDLPLVMFGIFDAPLHSTRLDATAGDAHRLGAWSRAITRESYVEAIDRIHAHIAAGDTYQVNFTLRQHADFSGDAEACFSDLARSANAPYCAFVDAGRFAVLSFSPELFFSLRDGLVTSIPMKGTAARALTAEADSAAAQRLRACEKNRAENVMITDMVRNDIGRIAEAGSVHVPALFDVERYPTVWQMTSTVTGRTREPISALMRAMFPPASITGAPKARAMEIISSLENDPRGIYTGTVGFVAPAARPAVTPRAQFNVAIRTILIDRERGRAEFGTGSGIVWESVASDEWLECETKTRVLAAAPPSFRLLETLRWDPPGEAGREGGYALLDAHLLRLKASAEYFQFELDPASAGSALLTISKSLAQVPHRVRLLVDREGRCECEASPLAANDGERVRLAVSATAVDSSNVFLHHKTTAREVYDAALAAFPAIDDVLLWNERGELTETCTANVCLLLDGEWVTPPVSSGLLAGTYRARVLAEGRVHERVLTRLDLARADAIAVINSVRGWRDAEVVDPSGEPDSQSHTLRRNREHTFL